MNSETQIEFGTAIFTENCKCCLGSGKILDSVKMGEELKRSRKALNISTTQLAEKTGISQQEICKLESGQRQWTFEHIAKFYKGLSQFV